MSPISQPLTLRHGARSLSRAEGWSHGVRLRERTAPADGAAADAWSIEAGVGFDVSSSAEGRWRYHGDVKGSYAAGGVLTPHGFGYSQSAHAEPQRPDPGSESADGGESSAAKGRLGWSWSYYGGWRDGDVLVGVGPTDQSIGVHVRAVRREDDGRVARRVRPRAYL